MRFIFINRFYWPEEPATAQLLTDLAEELARRGQNVTVITSHPGTTALPHRETHRGVRIRRVHSTRWRGPGRIIDFVTFQVSALVELLLAARPDDRIVVLTDPPLLGVGAWLVGRLCGARVFHWIQDIYPEIAQLLTGHRWLGILRPLRNLAWRRADGCVALGADMAATVVAAGVAPGHVTVIPNWAPAGLHPQPPEAAAGLRHAWDLAGKFVVAYSGNLGRVHDLGPVLAVAEALRREPAVAFVFIGAGPQRADLAAEAGERGLANIHFHPSQPRARLNETLALGDIHLVTLLPGCEPLVFPSKLYGIAAVGRPVLFIGPRGSELAQMVENLGFGRAFTRDEVPRIAAAILELRANPPALARMGSAAIRFYESGPSAGQSADRWLALAAPTAT